MSLLYLDSLRLPSCARLRLLRQRLTPFLKQRPENEEQFSLSPIHIARRGPRSRTHYEGTRRTFPDTSQEVPCGEAFPLVPFQLSMPQW